MSIYNLNFCLFPRVIIIKSNAVKLPHQIESNTYIKDWPVKFLPHEKKKLAGDLRLEVQDSNNTVVVVVVVQAQLP